ncbi:dUTP diphosphatase [Actinokineospora sp. PR83]|nr:dUTP diphosphatase [Actinokineospora sp. PR83]MCG8917116.1 dUTP diphosphatase [Actinokineospora sp. PR83]
MKLLDPTAQVPQIAHPGDAGADLFTTADIVLGPGQRCLASTGIAIELPPGLAGFIHPRSGLAAKHGLSIVNSPGTIDSGYRGEIKVALINLDQQKTIELSRGDRIAQLVVQRVEDVLYQQVEELDVTARGEGGFGSTG